MNAKSKPDAHINQIAEGLLIKPKAIASLYAAGPEPMMGMVFAKITTEYKNLLPGKRNLAKAYARSELEPTFTDTYTIKIHKELRVQY